MSILYLDEYGATLRASGGRLLIEKDGETLVTARPQEVELVIVLANCGFTSAAAQILLNQGIDVAFVDTHGEYLGRLEGAMGKNVLLRRRQYALADDPEFCLALARALVQGKVANMRTIVMRYAREGVTNLHAPIAEMAAVLDGLDVCPSQESLRGMEGTATAAYFGAMARIVQPPFSFSGRNRRPPQDPVNAMLGFSYALLLSYVERAVSAVGLDAYCGYYHQDTYGV
ncbi:MAG: CRISPR-associated protein Cas4/endonuclease Cas1 fusion [bacterium ADurb.Bin429]|nr:MAG: CRISPR-associated protein Cas4/endonuclease Cas1 fusion [bacterium ADurb.Bin429]